ncbi:MAG: ribosome-binding factor [Acidobacteriota bacterium]|jgi:ribosome-binding factor A|nr:ribosome-binding factor [Acidobacteriota bacterium]
MRRPERIADMLREEIMQIVGYELEDPRVAAATVTDVRLSENLRDASVYVLVQGSEDEILTALTALRHAAPYVRKQVGFALNLRHTPEIHFIRDTIEEQGARIDRLLEVLEQESANQIQAGEFPGERMNDE